MALLLPYVEQDNAGKLMRLDRSVIDPVNLPPNWGTNVAGITHVKVYECPAAPLRGLDYGPYFVSIGFPDRGPMPLGPTDYAIIRGIRSGFAGRCCPTGTVSGDTGVMGQKSQVRRLTEILDGTSNTILVVEDAGRHQVYARGIPIAPNGPGQIGWTLNAAWADYNTAVRVDGFSADGLVRNGGCCVVNCNNVDEIYAFHFGGANTLRGDGSVFFLSEAVPPAVLAALISCNGGEVVPGDF